MSTNLLLRIIYIFLFIGLIACTEEEDKKAKSNIIVTTFAGSGTYGYTDGDPSFAKFRSINGLATDAQGNIFVADAGNNLIRKVSASGMVSTYAGRYYEFGLSPELDVTNGQAESATFEFPDGITIDKSGNIYLTDRFRIRKISPTKVVSTIAGSSNFGFLNGLGSTARFKDLRGITIDQENNLYVADSYNDQIRKITASGSVSTFSGSIFGHLNGDINIAQFSTPWGLTIDSQNNLLVAEFGSNLIRKINPLGNVSTLAGKLHLEFRGGFEDGKSILASFDHPSGVVSDLKGNYYIADYWNHCIRKIDAEGNVTTIAGTGEPGFINGKGNIAKFNYPYSLALDTEGNLYVGDQGNHCIRKITLH